MLEKIFAISSSVILLLSVVASSMIIAYATEKLPDYCGLLLLSHWIMALGFFIFGTYIGYINVRCDGDEE